MSFQELLLEAQMGKEIAMEKILEMFRPLLIKNAIINGCFNEDLYQELSIETIRCIQRFVIKE